MNILIVDDEQIILKWLVKKTEELSSDYHVVGRCTNGKQALSACLTQKIDVLITDIRMPVMDGMVLLQKLQESGIMPYTIILSAYDDFSYVRDAFKLGANEFLLKPEITEEGLRECLRLASTRLQHGRSNLEETIEGDSLQQIVEQFLLGTPLEADKLQKHWKMACGGTLKTGVLLLLEATVSGIGEQLQELTRFVYTEERLVFRMVSLSSKMWAFFSVAPLQGEDRFAEKLRETWDSFGMHQVYAGMSSPHLCDDLLIMREEAEQQLEYARYYALLGGCQAPKMIREQTELEQCGKSVTDLIQKQEFDMVFERIELLLQTARVSGASPVQVKRVALNLLLRCYWEIIGEEERVGIAVEDLIMASNAPTLEELAHQLNRQINQFKVILKNRRVQQGYSEAVSDAIRFIEQNFAQPIVLEDVAEKVHLNRSYISSLFKKETGENIFDYLLHCRMKKAKQLLMDKKYAVQQISAEVGIADAAYFSKLFKKHTGVTPLEFRKTSK